MCSWDSIASSIWSSPRTSANWLIFFILCLQRRHAATAAVTVAPQWSIPVSNLQEDCVWRQTWSFASVRPARLRPQHIAKDCCCGQAHKILSSYLQLWRGTTHGLQSFRACATTRTQLEGCNVPCKQYCCASGLQRYLIICTVPRMSTAARRTLRKLQICSRDTIASSSWSNPRTSANWLIFLIISLWSGYSAPDAVTAATQSSMPISNLHEVCVWRHKFDFFASIRLGDAFVSLSY